MMDIIEKKNIPFSPPDIGEEEINGVINTLKSGWITTGPKTKEFERRIADYCNTSRAVCLNSATACMELTLRLLGVGPGDEVITSAYTYTATCSVICHVGATPILVDVAKDSFEMDYNQLNAKITERTKVIIPIDLAGIMCDYKKIFEIVEAKKDLFKASNEIQKAFGRIIVMADAAHAFGASKDNKMCGEVADFTSFSFHAVKNLTTAEGGAVVWKDIENIDNENIYEQYQLLSLHGQSKDALAKTKLGAWEYDVISPAYKCNMTDIMAGIGLAQLDKYQKLLSRRKEIIYKYNEGLKDLDVQILNHYDENHNSSGHLYLVRINGISGEQRNEIITEMAKKGIACNVHYKPLPLLTAYKKLGFDIKDYPNAYNQFINEVTLPLHTKLSDDDINYILKKLCELL
ncbi:DegT/DnrJ/EryC1/StrS aminotransferase family protein [Erysipelatoclostridium ramosum]|nr:DegT/DnrJ/EryC1/StrS aminotransferase family protein [Thomasclavelia ramosa]MBV3165243.1 DegT/DnrJ/EryC1/StrS aminotransferase family protein [Erysipelatoclostridium sp. MSK.23.68]MBV3179609.1 DegT/DnrJ/EryC1/StrS aminotransferase family protein [Erysipelatoclostridium sp. MSK.23.67]MBV3246313.1 DegT/DnrJ/EryC1/StrS aminotransferase family protein [Erysipelatoclostridium sp. MSK.23.31]MBV3130583.1 DegT/DnrJ/EryC1/StrS aminotransferase family protein [Thomasclavelia ramosa]